MAQMGVQPHKHAEYSTSPSRLRTFDTHWPRNLPIDICDLVMHGLFYTGKSDWVVCYSCGSGFKNLTRYDNLLKIHAKTAPSCEFIRKNYCQEKLSQLIQKTELLEIRRKTFVPTESDFLIRMQGEACLAIRTLRKGIFDLKAKCMRAMDTSRQTVDILKRRLASSNHDLGQRNVQITVLNEKIRNLTLRLECSICLDKEVGLVTDCGHVFCIDCGKNIKICGLCRKTTGPCKNLYI